MSCPVVTASISAWSSEGGSVSVQARHHRLRVTAGVSQERMARNGLGQQGRWGWWDGADPPLSGPSSGHGSGAVASRGSGGANHWSQQKEKAQLTRVWWRRMARSERTWKSAQASSSLTCS